MSNEFRCFLKGNANTSLFLAPGLSIHCMQVHKEAIDKVPNSVPNRSNIEIEIYGMEGIPPQDIRDHEKQKNGNKSESDDDEPSVKKPKINDQLQLQQQQIQQPTQLPPQMVMQSLVSPFQMAPMLGQIPGMSPYMPVQMLNPHHMLGGQRPLFPSVASAIATSAIASQPKPTFPAYSNATISAPPTTNLGNSSATANSTTTNTNEPPKQPVLQTSGASSKILHPPEDTSLEEIRARKPQYKTNKSMHTFVSSPQSSASSTPTSVASSQKYSNETKMVAAAHEVC